jgi:hypothetical protein
MAEEYWIAVLGIVTLVVARASKRWEVPKWALPVGAVVLGYALMVGKGLLSGQPFVEAVQVGLDGLGPGVLAVFGHSTLKQVLTPILGPVATEWVLGRVQKPTERTTIPPSTPKVTPVALFLLCLLVSGCSGAAGLKLLQGLQRASQGAQWVAAILNDADAHADLYFDRHPNMDAEQAIDQAQAHVASALTAYNGVIAAGEPAIAGDVERARSALLTAYSELRHLLDALGVIDATPATGGAETEAPEPVPFAMPLAAEVEARL